MFGCRSQSVIFIRFDKNLPVWPIPCWNPVTPPKLARNTPRLDIAHPFKIGLVPTFRNKFGAAIFNSFDRWLRQLFGIYIPLIHQPWLDHNARTVTMRHHIIENFFLNQHALSLKIFQNQPPRIIPVKPLIFCWNFWNRFHRGGGGHQIDQG